MPQPVLRDDGAPIIAFDGIAAMGHRTGMFSLVLALGRPTAMADQSVPTVGHAVCQLYGNRDAMLALRDAIDKTLLLGTEAKGETH